MSTIPEIITAIGDSKLAIVIHRDAAILYANQTAIEMFGGHVIADVAKKKIDDFVDPSFLTKIEGRRTMFEAGKPLEPVEGKLLRLDGTPFAAAVTSLEIESDGDKTSLTIIIDLEHEQHQQDEIETLSNQIRQLMVVAVGREVKMEELKQIIEKLQRKA